MADKRNWVPMMSFKSNHEAYYLVARLHLNVAAPFWGSDRETYREAAWSEQQRLWETGYNDLKLLWRLAFEGPLFSTSSHRAAKTALLFKAAAPPSTWERGLSTVCLWGKISSVVSSQDSRWLIFFLPLKSSGEAFVCVGGWGRCLYRCHTTGKWGVASVWFLPHRLDQCIN